jgi:hypothetical protein
MVMVRGPTIVVESMAGTGGVPVHDMGTNAVKVSAPGVREAGPELPVVQVSGFMTTVTGVSTLPEGLTGTAGAELAAWAVVWLAWVKPTAFTARVALVMGIDVMLNNPAKFRKFAGIVTVTDGMAV